MVLRSHARNVQQHLDNIANFKTTAALCFSEADRPLVNGRIEAFMKSTGSCDVHESHELALQCFDEMVRKTIPGVLEDSIGRNGFLYIHALIIAQTDFWVGLDRVGGMTHARDSL